MIKQNKEKKYALALLSAVAVMMAVMLVAVLALAAKMRSELIEVSQQAPVASGFTFESEAHFHDAVVRSLNKMVADKQNEQMQEKLQHYELAEQYVPDNKKIYGNLDARFTLVEFSETECPFCLRHHPTMRELVDTSSGNINWQWRHLPLSFHNPAALHQAIVGECIAEQKGNKAFWVYIDEVFARSAGGGKGVPNLLELSEFMGADTGKLRECIGSDRAKAIVEADLEEAKKLGINGTPATIVVDNHTGRRHVISGAQPAGAFISTINRMANETAE